MPPDNVDGSTTAAATPASPIPTVTLTSGDPQPLANQPVEQVKAPEPAQVDSANQVTVQAIRSFQGEEGFKNPQSKPFVVSRQRAADLFAGGLIEYVDQAEEDAAIDAVADAQIATLKANAQARRSKK